MRGEAREQLEAWLRKQPEESRILAESDLELLQQGTDLTLEGLVQVVSDPAADPHLRAIGAWALGVTGDRSLAPGLEQLARKALPVEVLLEVSRSLCGMGCGASTFLELLESPSPEERRIAAYTLGCLRDVSAAEALCRVARSPQEQATVRSQAVEALGYLGLESTLPCLLEAAHDPLPDIRFWAAFAMGQIGSPAAEPVLSKMAQSDHAVVDDWWEVSQEASSALEQIRNRSDS